MTGSQNSLYATTAAFELDASGNLLPADNQFRDYSARNVLVGNFQGATNIPCALETGVTSPGQCKKAELPQGPIVTTEMNPSNCPDLSAQSARP
jgi:hypothetical protein